MLSIRASLPHLRTIVLYGGEEVPAGVEGVVSWAQLIATGRDATDTILRTRLANMAINQVKVQVLVHVRRRCGCKYEDKSA